MFSGLAGSRPKWTLACMCYQFNCTMPSVPFCVQLVMQIKPHMGSWSICATSRTICKRKTTPQAIFLIETKWMEMEIKRREQ
uniref:Uncharacterized protein n=1 Tax=Rhizophora mucronata TaxID=61149 RepID=A0A2P2MX00_RHIMU